MVPSPTPKRDHGDPQTFGFEAGKGELVRAERLLLLFRGRLVFLRLLPPYVDRVTGNAGTVRCCSGGAAEKSDPRLPGSQDPIAGAEEQSGKADRICHLREVVETSDNCG